MAYHTTTLLNAAGAASSDPVLVARHGRLLITVTLTGEGSVSVQGRQRDGSWRPIERFTENGELHIENFGWYEIRAVSHDMSEGATASAVLSWR